jgi:ABC-2 type transport system permease protein
MSATFQPALRQRGDFLRVAWAVCREEWRALWRSAVAVTAGTLLLVLTVAATLVSWESMRAVEAERAHLQHEADEQWNAQPDRHPHRVVHYGHYIFRPLSPLAFFDFGVDPYTGHTLFLEGHRQNSANFSDAGQSSVLLRFGQLTPAFVVQTLTPLVIVFLAFGSVARERERGQVRLLIAQGLPGSALLAGKLASHAAVALLLVAPALAALALIGIADPSVGPHAAWMAGGYVVYVVVWALAAVLVSAATPRARDALLVLVGAWIVTVILLPRVMPDVATAQVPRPTRIETEVAIHKELAAFGDSHNPDDPHYKEFRRKVLAKYGVSRIEDLPVNYGGLVIEEGERLTSALFVRHMHEEFERQQEQAAIVAAAQFVSPVLALRRLSNALAGTDRASHERFLLEGEAYRYRMIQALNALHVSEVRYQDDRDQRISKSFFQRLPRFVHEPIGLPTVVEQHVRPALAVFALWLAVLVGGAWWLARRLERGALGR